MPLLRVAVGDEASAPPTGQVVVLRPGSTVSVLVSGPCAGSVMVRPSGTLLDLVSGAGREGEHTFVAKRPGRDKVTVSLSACARPPGAERWSECRGPASRLLDLDIEVRGLVQGARGS